MDFFADFFVLEMTSIEKILNYLEASARQTESAQTYLRGITKYVSDFMVPYWIALDSFLALEKDKLLTHFPSDTSRDYLELM